MCIRDRKGICPANIVISGFGGKMSPLETMKSVGVKLVNIPVSYTHLRAHETVLDLVCRLLLEKKKNRIHYITCCHATNIITSYNLSYDSI